VIWEAKREEASNENSTSTPPVAFHSLAIRGRTSVRLDAAATVTVDFCSAAAAEYGWIRKSERNATTTA
jgi:hypothetical protein